MTRELSPMVSVTLLFYYVRILEARCQSDPPLVKPALGYAILPSFLSTTGSTSRVHQNDILRYLHANCEEQLDLLPDPIGGVYTESLLWAVFLPRASVTLRA